MTQSHIQFEPLILPRKTPAEELREIVRRINIAPNYETRESLECLAARLEAPDEPKRWDGVWPWVVCNGYKPENPFIHFGESLRLTHTLDVYGDRRFPHQNERPYHDGVIITITAGSGDEFPRVVKAKDQTTWLCCGVGPGKSIYLDGAPNVFTVGDIPGWLDTSLRASPLPPGTVTRITISNHGATTEQRYSVEVVEPEKVEDWLPVEPVGRYLRLDRHADSDKLELQYRNGTPIIDIDGLCAAELRDCLTRWLDESRTDPPEEQPATEVAAERLPLEIACDCDTSGGNFRR